MKRDQYRALLKDPKWKIKAKYIRIRDGYKCRNCGKKTHRLQVHHIKYIDGLNPWEYDDSLLISLCSACHKKEHNIKPKTKKPISKQKKPKKNSKKRIIIIKEYKENE